MDNLISKRYEIDLRGLSRRSQSRLRFRISFRVENTRNVVATFDNQIGIYENSTKMHCFLLKWTILSIKYVLPLDSVLETEFLEYSRKD